jgi:hypothetical protein
LKKTGLVALEKNNKKRNEVVEKEEGEIHPGMLEGLSTCKKWMTSSSTATTTTATAAEWIPGLLLLLLLAIVHGTRHRQNRASTARYVRLSEYFFASSSPPLPQRFEAPGRGGRTYSVVSFSSPLDSSSASVTQQQTTTKGDTHTEM